MTVPGKIWAWGVSGTGVAHIEPCNEHSGCIGFIREDIVEELVQALESVVSQETAYSALYPHAVAAISKYRKASK